MLQIISESFELNIQVSSTIAFVSGPIPTLGYNLKEPWVGRPIVFKPKNLGARNIGLDANNTGSMIGSRFSLGIDHCVRVGGCPVKRGEKPVKLFK